MNTYRAEIDGGELGEEAFQAHSAEEALERAIEWAQKGDWDEQGCEVTVSVINCHDEGDTAEKILRIPSAAERRLQKCAEEGEVLFELEGEFNTQEVVRIAEDYFHVRLNGGSRGSWNDGKGGVAGDQCKDITRREARRLGLEWGYALAEVAAKTRD